MKPTLVVLAAGIGSRYGGLKQLDAIGPGGETIIDYSVYDAIRAGFGKVVFVIKESIEKEFNDLIVAKLQPWIDIVCVYQELGKVPSGITVPADRVKPWGTGHAVLMAAGVVDTPFAVINSDDFYGREAYETLAGYYRDWTPEKKNDYSMVAYEVGKTLSEFGSVSRGVCYLNDQGQLVDVVERTSIERTPAGIGFRDESGAEIILPGQTVVSMNFWGFTPSFFGYLESGFSNFIRENAHNPKAEYYIPTAVNALIREGTATVQVLSCSAQWFGMTYREDRDQVTAGIRQLIEKGVYPVKLWS